MGEEEGEKNQKLREAMDLISSVSSNSAREKDCHPINSSVIGTSLRTSIPLSEKRPEKGDSRKTKGATCVDVTLNLTTGP